MTSHVAWWRRTACAGAILGLAPCSIDAFGQTVSPSFWIGPFVGAEIVGSIDSVTTTETTAATGVVFHRFQSLGIGPGGGVNIGYNWLPWRNDVLVGVVADIDGLDNPGGHVVRTSDDVAGTAAVRAGYLSDPSLLWYAQTGIAVASESVKINFGGPITSQTRTEPGYALGGGVEWVLPVAPTALGATTLFFDYRHIWWSGGTLDTPAAEPTLNFRWQRDANMLTAGLRLHF